MKCVLFIGVLLAFAGICIADSVTFDDCGEGLTCTLTEEGEFSVTGAGAMNSFLKASRPSWYENADSIKKIVIGDDVTEVGNYTFAGCSNLETVTFGEKVAYVGDCAFYNCSKLDHVTLPTAKIEERAFSECSSLVDLNISTATYLGMEAFEYCGLVNVTIPATLTEMGHAVFHSCKSLKKFIVEEGNPSFKASDDGVLFDDSEKQLLAYPPALELKSYTTPKNVNYIDERAFRFAQFLQEVVVSDGPDMLAYEVFGSCHSLTSVKLPDTIKKFKQGVFDHCTSLEKIHIPDNVNGIGARVFAGCSSLKEVNIPDRVTWIMKNTFDTCSNLQSITIPSGIEKIQEKAFFGCTQLSTVIFDGTPESLDNFDETAFKNCDHLDKICVADGYKFEKFCGVNVSKTCFAHSSSSSSSAAPVTTSSSSSSSPSPSSSSKTSSAALHSISAVAVLLMAVLSLLF